MTEARPGGSTRLHELLSSKLSGQIGSEEFCREYEHAFNFEVRPGELGAEEERIFGELFDVVAWFTPDDVARGELPTHFKDGAAVEAAVLRARQRLAKLMREEEA